MRDGLEGRFDLTAPPNWTAVYGRLKRRRCAHRARSRSKSRSSSATPSSRASTWRRCANRTAPSIDAPKALQTLTAQRRPQLAPELPARARRSGAARRRHPRDRGLRRRRARAAADRALQDVQQRREGRGDADAGLAAAIRPAAHRGDCQERRPEDATSRRMPRDSCCGSSAPGSSKCGVRSKQRERRERLLEISRAAQRHRDERRQPEERPRGVPAHLRRLPQAVRRGGHARSGSDRLEPRQSGLAAVQRAGSERAKSRTPTRWWSITTRDGRTYSGNVVSENDRQVTLRVVGREARSSSPSRTSSRAK